MKNISLLIVFLFSSITLIAQPNSFSESVDDTINGALDFKTEIPKGLEFQKSDSDFEISEFPKTPKYKAIPLYPADSEMKIYTPDCNCKITNYKPENAENYYLKVYHSK